MTTDLVLRGGETALAVALQNKDPDVVGPVMVAFGLTTQLGLALPFSRSHESEADHIGLLYMARAGYDPRRAVEFWQRMDALAGPSTSPEFLSTHPSGRTRIADLNEWMPEAIAVYEPRPPVSSSTSEARD